MKIVLATGIYPPDIGGPATYVRELARELASQGNEVIVITYGRNEQQNTDGRWAVYRVRRWAPVFRWWRYARALRKHAKNADILYAFSSVSCGVPMILARLKHPKKVLRLGGDFFWERYTDRGGTLSLAEWYKSKPWSKCIMQWILRKFDHIAFSTRFQQELYLRWYRQLPGHSVLENALPEGTPRLHEKHLPFHLLFMGRFVGFKNLSMLLHAVLKFPGVRLTLIGAGPMEKSLKQETERLLLSQRVTFLESVQGEEKQEVFQEYDLLILPSLTEISPNVALEARAAGLPVLLSSETGLSKELTSGMTLTELKTPIEITRAIAEASTQYELLAAQAAEPAPRRTWQDVQEEHMALFQRLL
ncbi:hypothetical protein COU78_00730 [Candidatus Peregrinibacteria bacterium CG10_big_fil_rev_8_21_14_0_10_49_24]|nr:MAG: hypothetical protein COV83_00980 [Candidatus Peregrinibacteria bacterium CG11_big_fil_rev_8_21_14_0_20_49_14]PIR51477.1 MAG: hypothetical protein COU78_00730 [Candidatus Peregrinibacteria bacterium CG10_big_fil_rev_8_21_14_0_10_49_24]PJA67880.1 MAG: hypothetical protein CO157_02610 [Candidatus Peregrinibacteria bacterium CG_4_9_14_3_um_filter_49_12]